MSEAAEFSFLKESGILVRRRPQHSRAGLDSPHPKKVSLLQSYQATTSKNAPPQSVTRGRDKHAYKNQGVRVEPPKEAKREGTRAAMNKIDLEHLTSYSLIHKHDARTVRPLKHAFQQQPLAIAPAALGLAYDVDKGRFVVAGRKGELREDEEQHGRGTEVASAKLHEEIHFEDELPKRKAATAPPLATAVAIPNTVATTIMTAAKTAEITAAAGGAESAAQAAHGSEKMRLGVKEALEKLTLTALISNRNLWWAGIICASVAAVSAGLGDCVLRHSFVEEQTKGYMEVDGEAATSPTAAAEEQRRARKKKLRPLCQRPLWLLGMFLTMIINPVLTLVAFRFTAMSIVSMFGGLHILSSLLFATVYLNEALQWRDALGGCLIVAGTIAVVAFGHTDSPAEEFYVDSVAFCIFSGSCLIAITFAILISFRSMVFCPTSMCAWLRNTCCIGKLGLTHRGFSAPRRPPFKRLPALAGTVCTALVPGIAGALSNLCGKGGVVLWTDALQDPRIWRYPYTWIFAVGAVTAAAAQIVFLSVGLSRYPASFVSPVYNATLICLNSIGGVWIFAEYARHLPYYLIGLSCLFGGIWSLSRGQEIKMEHVWQAYHRIQRNSSIVASQMQLPNDGPREERITRSAEGALSNGEQHMQILDLRHL